MTTFLLIRHGETDAIGKSIAGSMPGWHLNSAGRTQAIYLGMRLSRLPIAAIYSSPLERAIETVEPLAAVLGLPIQPLQDLGETRFGKWEGCTFDELDQSEEWKRFNLFRSSVQPPEGEMTIEMQTRTIRAINSIRMQHRHELVAIGSHGDPLRSVLAHFLGIPLDFLLRFEISPASVSVVEVGDLHARVLCMNETGDIPL